MLQHPAALLGRQACGGKEFLQGNVVPVAHHLVQLPLQAVDPLEVEAEQQRPAAARNLGKGGKEVGPVGQGQPPVDRAPKKHLGYSVGEAHHPDQQQDGPGDGAQAGQALLAELGFLLLGGGSVVGCIVGAVIISALSLDFCCSAVGVSWAA